VSKESGKFSFTSLPTWVAGDRVLFSLVQINDTDLFFLIKPRTGERHILNLATLLKFKILQVGAHKVSVFLIFPYLRWKLQFSEVRLFYSESRDSAAGIATGYELDVPGDGIRVPVGA
jgi:hypothetical protein